MKHTKHADERIQQRGIPRLVPEILRLFGNETYQKGGYRKIKMSTKGKKHAIKELKKALAAFENSKSYFCVENEEGLVITAGHIFGP